MSSPQSCCDGTEQQASAQTTLPSKLYLTSLIASGCCCKGRGQVMACKSPYKSQEARTQQKHF